MLNDYWRGGESRFWMVGREGGRQRGRARTVNHEVGGHWTDTFWKDHQVCYLHDFPGPGVEGHTHEDPGRDSRWRGGRTRPRKTARNKGGKRMMS